MADGASPSALRAGVGGGGAAAAERRVGFSPQGPCQGCASVSSPAAGEHRQLWGVLDADATREGVTSMAVLLLLPGPKRCVRGPRAGPSGRVLASHTDGALPALRPPPGGSPGPSSGAQPSAQHSLPLLMLLPWLACGLLFPTFPFWPLVILSSTCASSGLWALERRDLGQISLRDWSLELPGGGRARRLVGTQMFPAQPPRCQSKEAPHGSCQRAPREDGEVTLLEGLEEAVGSACALSPQRKDVVPASRGCSLGAPVSPVLSRPSARKVWFLSPSTAATLSVHQKCLVSHQTPNSFPSGNH